MGGGGQNKFKPHSNGVGRAKFWEVFTPVLEVLAISKKGAHTLCSDYITLRGGSRGA